MKTFKPLAILFMTFLVMYNLNAQCGFDIQRSKLLQDPNYAIQEQKAEEKLQLAISNMATQSTADVIYTIPVVVHVLHLGEAIGTGTNISDAQIQSSIDNLNDFYGGLSPNSPIDFEIQFELAKRDPNCNSTTGINRIDASGVTNYSSFGVSFQGLGADETTLKDLSRWPETDYLNIWIVSEIDNNNGGFGFQGYANFFNGNSYEGSVMMHTVFGYDPNNLNPSWPLTINRDNSVVVHEVGHYFHLYHTFQGDDANGDGVSDQCPNDIGIGDGSDGCADTETHQRHTSTCPTNNNCNSNNPYDPNTLNNIMSYFSCTDRLTVDQKTRARAALDGTTLVNSSGAIAPIPFNPPLANSCTPQTDPSFGLTGFYSGIGQVDIKDMTSISGYPSGDNPITGTLDRTANCERLISVELNEVVPFSITTLFNNGNNIKGYLDYDNSGSFEPSEEIISFSGVAQYTTVSGNFTIPLTASSGTNIRLRVIQDLGNIISGPCFNPQYGQAEDYSVYIDPPINYTYDNGSWSPSDPNGLSSQNDQIEITSGNATISINSVSDIVTVNPGASLTIDTGVNLTANTLTLNSSSQQYSSLILNGTGTITGTVNYERFVDSDANGRDLISPPLSGQLFSDFYNNNSDDLINNGGTPNALVLFGPFDNSANPGEYVNYLDNSSASLNAGTGYRTATNSGSTLQFSGTINTGTVPVTITDEIGNYGSWNLIGNPYPSYLSFKDFYELIIDFDNSFTNNQLDPSYSGVYGYDSDATDGSIWTIWDLNNSTYVTDLIAPGQGFFVKSKSGGGSALFTSDMRLPGTDNDFITSNQTTSNNMALAKIGLSNSENSYYTNIYFRDGNSRGLEPGYDTGGFGGAANGIFTNLIEDNIGVELVNQSLPYEDMNDIIIPLGVHAEQGQQISIELNGDSTLPENINVYLEDNQTNNWILLNNSAYTFTPSENLNGTGRFFVHFSSNTLSIEDDSINGLNIYTDELSNTVIISGKLNKVVHFRIFDMQGRLVKNQGLDSSTTSNIVDVSALATGVYIVDLKNDTQQVSQKIIIK